MNAKIVIVLLFLSTLTQSSEEQTSCDSDSDCPIYNVCSNSKCERKELFPMANAEIGGTFLLIFMAIISISGGIGGSAICSALLLSLYRFMPHQAVALTQSFLFSGTVTAVSLKIRDRHPTRDRPIIYYDFLLQLSCPLVLGVSIGVLVNPAFPGWLILALLTVVIAIVVALTFRNGLIIFKEEQILRKELKSSLASERLEAANLSPEPEGVISDSSRRENHSSSESNNSPNEDEASLSNHQSIENSDPVVVSINSDSDKINSDDNQVLDTRIGKNFQGGENFDKDRGFKQVAGLSEVECMMYDKLPEGLRRSIVSIRLDEKKPISFIHILFFVLMTGFGICFTIFRGTANMKSKVGIGNCSEEFYAMLFFYIFIMLGLSFSISFYLIRKNRVCESSGYDFDESDIRWSLKNCFFFICMGLLIGILVGIIGFGGFIVSPILLHLKIDPEITTLSSLFTIMLTSLSALIQFYIAGITNWKYSLYLIVCAHLGSLVAILVVRKYFLKIRRKSFLVFALVVVFFTSFCIIPTFGIINLIKQREAGEFQLGFKPLCGS